MKKNRLFVTLIITGVLCFTSCYGGKSDGTAVEKNYITVTGTGAVSVKPDIVSLKFSVKTSDWNVNRAVEKNAINTTNVINSVKNAGVAESDITTYDYRITQDNSHDYPGQYTALNTIAVSVRDVSNAGKVIDAAVKNNIGANGITQFKYIVSDKTSALRQARTLAVENAQDAAALLAGASGCKVGAVVDLKEDYTSSGNYNDGMYRAMPMEDTENGVTTPITEGNITITSNITVKYELVN